VPRRISQGRELSVRGLTDLTTLDYSVNHARSGSNSCSASMAPLAQFALAAPRRYSDRAPIFMAFRGPQAQANQLRKLSRLVSQSLAFGSFLSLRARLRGRAARTLRVRASGTESSPKEPAPKPLPLNELHDQPIRSIELPQRNSLI
jgi:hypothetical protein